VIPNELEHYLFDHIPLSKALQVSVLEIREDEVVVEAPLSANINHCSTVFGGSASAVAILAAWSLLYIRLKNVGINSQLVIQRNTMEYEHPIAGDFVARSSLTHAVDWSKFIRMLSRKGKARISVSSVLECNGKLVGHLKGDFVAFSNAK